jgi:hypothetical protein
MMRRHEPYSILIHHKRKTIFHPSIHSVFFYDYYSFLFCELRFHTVIQIQLIIIKKKKLNWLADNKSIQFWWFLIERKFFQKNHCTASFAGGVWNEKKKTRKMKIQNIGKVIYFDKTIFVDVEMIRQKRKLSTSEGWRNDSWAFDFCISFPRQFTSLMN